MGRHVGGCGYVDGYGYVDECVLEHVDGYGAALSHD